MVFSIKYFYSKVYISDLSIYRKTNTYMKLLDINWKVGFHTKAKVW